MKSYPSILHATGQSFREFDAHVFDKLDGSNLRWEWSKKAGWHKFGTRRRLFDEKDEVFGEAIDLFKQKLAEPVERIAHDQRWPRIVAFTEFWGLESFAGLHEPEDSKFLTLFDIDVYKQGLIDPRKFLKLFDDLDIPRYLGKMKWTRGFVQSVRDGDIPVTFEGVVGKAMAGRKRIMAKAKTQAWVDRVIERYSSDEAESLIRS